MLHRHLPTSEVVPYKGPNRPCPFLANGSDLYNRYSEHLIHENRPDEALNVIDESRAESLEDGLHLARPEQKGHSSQGLNARAIAARLQATILVYSLRPKTSYLWVITPTRRQFYPIAGSETILPLIQLHTKMILASKDLLSQPAAPGRALYDQLVQPAQSLIKKGSKIFIVGDDALNSLNFETLQTPGEDSHYWIEDVTITNAKSLQLLAVSEPKETRYADKRILLMGNPVYRTEEYAELPNAATEITNIANHFSADHRMVLTGPQASPEEYQHTQAGQFSYIHFVAHATANMTSPLDSAVVLSRNQDDAAVYKLYARDILKQNLHADLVTVSACYGSGLRNYSGEGLVGLAWAFSPCRFSSCHRSNVGGQRCLYTIANGPSLHRTRQRQPAGRCTQVCETLHDSLRRSLPKAAVLGSVPALFRSLDCNFLSHPTAHPPFRSFQRKDPTLPEHRVLIKNQTKIRQPTVCQNHRPRSGKHTCSDKIHWSDSRSGQ